MNSAARTNAVQKNAAVLALGILASFVLPMVGDSMTDGSAFLRMFLHVAPLVASLFVSTVIVNAATTSTDQ
jgi:hypothetical protein